MLNAAQAPSNRPIVHAHLLRADGGQAGPSNGAGQFRTAWYGRTMARLGNDELIEAARERLNPHPVGDRLFGDVAAALETHGGNQYTGVCIDTPSATGFCAEHAAIAAMVTAGEYRIARIVAVWRSDAGTPYVLPPCGRCREFIRQVDEANIQPRSSSGAGDPCRCATCFPPTSGRIRSDARPPAGGVQFSAIGSSWRR